MVPLPPRLLRQLSTPGESYTPCRAIRLLWRREPNTASWCGPDVLSMFALESPAA